MSPWEAIIEKVPEGCRTLLAAAAALAMTMMATMLALTADAHVLALVDDLLRENSTSSGVRVDRMRSATSDCAAQRFSASASPSGVMRTV